MIMSKLFLVSVTKKLDHLKDMEREQGSVWHGMPDASLLFVWGLLKNS